MSNELVSSSPPETAQPLVPLDPFKGKRSIAVFLDQDSPARIAQLGRAVQVDDTNWPDEATVVDCVGITVWQRKVSSHDEPVEKTGVYTAVHCKDGTNYITSSSIVLDSLPQIAASLGQPPWPTGAEITIGKKHKTKGDLGRCWIAAGDVTIAPSI